METILIISKQVIILFLLVGVGFACSKMKMVDGHSARQFSTMLITFVMSCITLRAFQRDFLSDEFSGLLVAMLMAVVSHAIGVAFAFWLIKCKKGNGAAASDRVSVVLSNCAFMGFPLLLAYMGQMGVFYGTAYAAVFNIVCWTVGVSAITYGEKLNVRKAFLNPGVISFAVAIALYLLQLKLPDLIMTAVNYVADMNTPLAMIIIGVLLGNCDIKAAIKDFSAYKVLLLRLIATPLVLILLCWVISQFVSFPHMKEIMLAIIIATACPCGASGVSLAAKYGGDSERGAKLLSMSTLASLITLPLMVFLATALLQYTV